MLFDFSKIVDIIQLGLICADSALNFEGRNSGTICTFKEIPKQSEYENDFQKKKPKKMIFVLIEFPEVKNIGEIEEIETTLMNLFVIDSF